MILSEWERSTMGIPVVAMSSNWPLQTKALILHELLSEDGESRILERASQIGQD
jgi:hypothetical protein